MKRLPSLLLMLGVALLAPAQARQIGQDAQGAAGVPATHSVEQADATLARVAQDRAAVQQRYAASEQLCYAKFFVNNCLDKAREERRAALAELHAVEVEANHFKRLNAVERRDQELAERARKDAEEQALRAAQPPKPTKAAALDAPPRAAAGAPSLAERQAAHDARTRRQQAEQAAGAGQRAANVAAYEKKQRDAAQRQAAIARKKEQTASKRAAREEAERKKAEAVRAAASALKQ